VQHSPGEDFSRMCLPFPVLFGANCLIRTKSRRWRLVAGTELIVVYENAHAPQTEPCRQSGGRLITNSEFFSSPSAEDHRDAGGDVRIVSRVLQQHSLTDLQPTLIEMVHRFAELRHKWVVRPQMQRQHI
jgi:hypothetical protein